ncbi:rod shape-determining protein MreD [Pseudaestuariivita sp.]|uniref:rod shape-determining protein MreD n=1 Tax=Pseudaestuariivita sp. TaxID=2211669 RepID=UPI0040596914
MAERADLSHVWTMRATFVALCFGVLVVYLLPTDALGSRWPAPDLMLALTFVWALRRPRYVPILLIALVFLLADLLFQRPPGLLAGLVVMATEWLKGRARTMRDGGWVTELATAVGALVAVTLAYRLILIALFVPVPPLALTLIELIFTAAAIPVLMVLSRLAFGLRRTAPGEVDTLGHRL